MDEEIFACSITDKTISKTRYINHVLRKIAGFKITGFKNKGNIVKPFTMAREVVIGPPGGMVLPYFKDIRGQWKIALVSQYRPAIKGKTIEAPGGIIGAHKNAQRALSRELREETGIKTRPESIKMTLDEYVLPSFFFPSISGGIVRIGSGQVKNKRNAGKKRENEWTQVEVFDLIEILKNRDNGFIILDLLTSRLLDEVAKTVGLLVKKY